MIQNIDKKYNTDWYNKRIKQNKTIKTFLIDKILFHKEKELDWTKEELLYLNYEDLFEIAVAAVNKNISITLGKGQDWNSGSDGKVSIVRLNNYGRSYSASVKVKNKKHIRALIYEGKQDKFYFFNFPATLKEHSIPFDLHTGHPKKNLSGKKPNEMWNKWQCNSFEEMALK